MTMTNKQYLTKALCGLNLSEDDIDIILLKGGIDADAPADVRGCDTAIYRRLSVVLKACLQNVDQGDYSIEWNLEAVKLFYASLCHELGRENVLFSAPKVNSKSDIW